MGRWTLLEKGLFLEMSYSRNKSVDVMLVTWQGAGAQFFPGTILPKQQVVLKYKLCINS
jgi:hypothetical protein